MGVCIPSSLMFQAIGRMSSESVSCYRPGSYKTRRIDLLSAIVMKIPQKREIGNYGLSMSYDVRTRMTTALLYAHGTHIKDYNRYEPDIKQPGLLTLLRDAFSAWDNPLVLPCMLLSDHLRRTVLFCTSGRAMQETWAIEEELGVTYVGRKVPHTPSRSSPAQFAATQIKQARGKGFAVVAIGRAKAEELTVRINTHSTRIIFTARSPQWNRDCSSFILDLLKKYSSAPWVPDAVAHHELQELLEHNIIMAESMMQHVASLKERIALQLNTLYTVTAQMDNRLSARLAANSGRDSVSMKILAFITALFLPGTFIATLFSMSMFDWQHGGDAAISASGGSGDRNGGLLSDQFWIYWAVSVPLTMLTLVGWAVWWKIEIGRYQQSFADAMDESDGAVVKPANGGESTFASIYRKIRQMRWDVRPAS